MQQWEYNDVIVGKDSNYASIELLDAAGRDGWEFTGTIEYTDFVKIYLMKRPILVEDEVEVAPVFRHTHSIKAKCWMNCPLRGTTHEITYDTL